MRAALWLAVATAQDVAFRVGFGSCVNQLRRSRALERASTEKPHAFVFLGDNVYHDMPSCGIPWSHERCSARDWLQVLRRVGTFLFRVATQGPAAEDSSRRTDDYDAFSRDHVAPFMARSPDTQLFATWDDHDYGRDDAGEEYVYKNDSRRQFLQFWNRSTSREGIFESGLLEKNGKTVHVIVLDTRWSRTAWLRAAWGDRMLKIATMLRDELFGTRPTVCPPEADRGFQREPRMLSEEQWRWLEEQLHREADLTIVASSVQVLRPKSGGLEGWSLMPRERQRLLHLLRGRVVILSGDVHYGELSASDGVVELTSSGLTETWPCAHPNPLRVGTVVHAPNFGLVDLLADGTVRLALRDAQGNDRLVHTLPSAPEDPPSAPEEDTCAALGEAQCP